MVGFKFSNGGRKCIRQILQAYQSGESVGYTVKSMKKDFAISSYPLEQTEFLYDSKQGMVDFFWSKFFLEKMMDLKPPFFQSVFTMYKNQRKARDKFEDEQNTQFDYSMFHYRMG